METNLEQLKILTQELIEKDDALKRSEEQFKALVDSIPDLVYKIDKDGVIVYIGGNIELFGYTQEDAENAIGKMFIEFVYEQDREMVLESFRVQREKNNTQYGNKEFRLKVKNRGHKWVNVRANSQIDNDNNVLYEIGVCRDITEWKTIEQKLKRSEERYRNIVEDQTEFIRRVLPDGTLTFINTAYARFFEKEKENLIGENFFNFIPEQEQEYIKEHFNLLTPDNPSREITHKVIINNKTKYQRWTDRMIFDEKNMPLVIQSVGKDVTDQLRFEELIYRRCNMLQTMSDNMEALVWVKDANNKYMFASKLLCEKILGCDPDQAIGYDDKEISDIYKIAQKYIQGDINGITDNITKDSKTSCRFYEIFITNDNGEYWLDVKKSPLFDIGGIIIGTVGVAFDITKDKEDIRKGIKNRITKGLVKEVIPSYVYQLTRV